MEEKIQFECAGNLSEELEEMNKSLCEKDVFYGNDTHTRMCGQFLTIYCC